MNKIVIKNKKELIKGISGSLFIIFTFIINGFLSFAVLGFDFSKILTSEYWADFTFLFASEILVLFGVYILQKIKDLKNKKITDLQDHINGKREIIYAVDKVEEAEDWLREVYNYKQKLIIFDAKIKSMDNRNIVKEPKLILKEIQKGKFKKLFNWILKIINWFKKINYNIKFRKYEKKNLKRIFLRQQMSFIKLDFERLKLIVSKDQDKKTKIEEIEKKINEDEYAFKTARIKYEEVYWGTLLSESDESKVKADSPYFHERKEMSKSIVKYLAGGLIVSAFLSSLVPPLFKTLGIETIIFLVIRFLVLMFFVIRGINLSNKLILGTFYKSLEKRKGIYSQMLKDLGVSDVIIEEKEVEVEAV